MRCARCCGDPWRLGVRWLREGFNTLDRAVPPGVAPAQPHGVQGRDVQPGRLGFYGDGAPRVDPARGRPAGVGGRRDVPSLRVIRMMVEFWDRTRLNEQETLIGRHRDSGAPLGAEQETDMPTFADDLTSHIARANPRAGE